MKVSGKRHSRREVGTSGDYIRTLLQTTRWRAALALGLMLSRTVAQGAQLLLLVPLMALVGLDIGQGSIAWVSGFVSSAFALLALEPTAPTVLGAFVVFSTVLALITRWQAVSNEKFQQGFVSTLRQRLYRAIVRADWLTLSRTRSSDFTHALTTETERTGRATAYLLELVTNAVLVSMYVLFALQLSAVMSLLVLASGSALLLALYRKTRKAREVGEEVSTTTRDMYSASIEHLGGMKTVKSHGVEERDAGLFSALSGRVAGARVAGSRNYAGVMFWFTAGSVLILSVILYVSLEVLELPAATLILLLFLFNGMIPLFNGVQQSYQEFLNDLPAFATLANLQRRCEEAAEPEAPYGERLELERGVRLEGVSFGYAGEDDGPVVIRELDLEVPAGRTTAVVGPSGAGKSTVADLVTGLVSPDRGRVLVDEQPLTADRARAWRARIGYVPQDTFLFNDTVRANLLWACPGSGDAAVWNALYLAAAGELVSRLPEGLDTNLGDRGVRLSGGSARGWRWPEPSCASRSCACSTSRPRAPSTSRTSAGYRRP